MIDSIYKYLNKIFFNNKLIKELNNYENYEEYLKHQKEKTTDPERINKWLNDEWEIKYNGFIEIFKRNKEYINDKKNAICLGSRTGQEVKALIDLGIKAIGIDLVEFLPYTIEGDIHNIEFQDNSFDLIFTNIVDHSLYLDKFCSEMERICIKGGILIIHLLIGDIFDEYTENYMYSPEAILKLFNNIDVIESKSIKNLHDSLQWELILIKK